MIVVDVNVIAYLLIAGEKSADAQALHELDPDWILPDLWRDEFLNILATYVQQGGADLESAGALWQSAVALFGPQERAADPLSVLGLAHRYRLSAYDAQYLAVAVQLSVPLITEDRALCQSTPHHSRSLRDYLEQRR